MVAWVVRNGKGGYSDGRERLKIVDGCGSVEEWKSGRVEEVSRRAVQCSLMQRRAVQMSFNVEGNLEPRNLEMLKSLWFLRILFRSNFRARSDRQASFSASSAVNSDGCDSCQRQAFSHAELWPKYQVVQPLGNSILRPLREGKCPRTNRRFNPCLLYCHQGIP